MFDHVKFGVSDYAASKAFFLKALEPLGVAVVQEGRRRTVSTLASKVRLHCACTKPRRSRRIFTWRSRPRIASKSKLSIARRWRRVAKTMVHLACSRTTTRTTMRLSSSVRTGTTSKSFATNPRPNPSIEGTSTARILLPRSHEHIEQNKTSWKKTIKPRDYRGVSFVP